MEKIKRYWEEKPLLLIMVLAMLFRLLAVIFSKGFGMHDDHFLIIEAAQSWADGSDYNNWLPGSNGNTTPSGHSFFYVGFHYLLFLFLNYLHIDDPSVKMYIVRFLHAIYSLIVVYLGYKITYKLSGKKIARATALLLALFWFMPFLSVRNLVEIVCIPLLIYGTWLIVKKQNNNKKLLIFLFSGFIFGLAFSVRFQTLMYTGGVGLALLMQKKWKETIFYGMGVICSIVLVQGVIDMFIWGYPFAELTEYIRYNIENAYNYNLIAWYSYILLVLGILVPPVSLMLIFGFFRFWKKYLIIFLPTLLFFIFHSYFPNKQERFILPVIPFIIILGMIGWSEFVNKSEFWKKRQRILKVCWIFFWVINLMLLPVISTTYSKKARVEVMVYLSKYDGIKYLVAEDSDNRSVKLLPEFYLGQWINIFEVDENGSVELLPKNIIEEKSSPSFVLFFGDKNLNERVEKMNVVFKDLKYETTIEPGFMDKVLHWLNPVNANQPITIYRVN